MDSLPIPERWLLDLQLVEGGVQMELSVFCETPTVGTVVQVDRYGHWEVLRVLRSATLFQGALLMVQLVDTKQV